MKPFKNVHIRKVRSHCAVCDTEDVQFRVSFMDLERPGPDVMGKMTPTLQGIVCSPQHVKELVDRWVNTEELK